MSSSELGAFVLFSLPCHEEFVKTKCPHSGAYATIQKENAKYLSIAQREGE